MKLSIPDYILMTKPYVPGKPLEELEREYGIAKSIKLASNENPLGPSPMAIKAIQNSLGKLHRYPDGSGHDLINRLSEHLSVAPENIVLGNGSDEILGMLTRAFLKPGDEALLPQPSFLMYEITAQCAGVKPVPVPLTSLAIDLEKMAERVSPETRMIFLCNPNNPTGTIFVKKAFETFLNRIPEDVIIVMDEAYIEFVRNADCAGGIEYLDSGRPLVTLRTFSKIYGLAGLRIGYGVMPGEIANLLNRVRMPFNANTLAQIGAAAALDDTAFLQETLRLVHEELDFLWRSLEEMGVRYFPSESNFFLIDVGKSADEVFEMMLRQGVIVRSMKSYGYPEYIRINAGLHQENVRFIEALKNVL